MDKNVAVFFTGPGVELPRPIMNRGVMGLAAHGAGNRAADGARFNNRVSELFRQHPDWDAGQVWTQAQADAPEAWEAVRAALENLPDKKNPFVLANRLQGQYGITFYQAFNFVRRKHPGFDL